MALICQGTVSTNSSGAAECDVDWIYHAGVTLDQLFNVPIVEDLQTAFMLGFGLPITCYLVSWGYQVVINFASKDPH